jgi:hypothetical protein
MRPMEMFHQAVHDALISDASDPGEHAGEVMLELARDRGLDIGREHNYYRCAINHAAAADLIVTAIRNVAESWIVPDITYPGWRTSALMNAAGNHLRRFLGVAYWGEERETHVKNSWHVLGEIAHYQMPMQLVVAVIGPMSGGRRHSPWSKALLHPKGNRLRFRLRQRSRVEGFAESWRPIYREDHDEIERRAWLQGMLDDGVLESSLFVVEVPVPAENQCAHIRDLALRQLGRLDAIAALPEKQLTSCDSPLRPCPFRSCCWVDPESQPEAGEFDPLS